MLVPDHTSPAAEKAAQSRWVVSSQFSKAVLANVSSTPWGMKAVRDFAGESKRGASVNGWHMEGWLSFSMKNFVVFKAAAGSKECRAVSVGEECVGLVTGLALGPAGGATVMLRMYVPVQLADPAEYVRKYPENQLAQAAADSCVIRAALVVPTPFWENNNSSWHGFVIV